MSEDKEKKVVEDSNKWEVESGEWIWSLLLLMIGFVGWGSSENPKIRELEKKVARNEGQMSMIGGKLHE